jgi:predicted nucleotidyltransferase
MTKPSVLLARHLREVSAILDQAGVANPRLFGSVARREDTSCSDIDIIVDVPPGTSLYDLADIEIAIERLLGCRVEVLTAGALALDVAERAERDTIPLDTFALAT